MDTYNSSQLRWQCRRGLLELDIMLINFLEAHYLHLNGKMRADFVKLLKFTDVELNEWLVYGYPCPDPALQEIINDINKKLILDQWIH